MRSWNSFEEGSGELRVGSMGEAMAVIKVRGGGRAIINAGDQQKPRPESKRWGSN